MNHDDCDPKDYMTWDAHEKLCDQKFEWVRESKDQSAKEREAMKEDISRLEGFKDKLLWVIIVASIGVIATNLIGPRLTPQPGVSELKGYIAELVGVVKDQQELIETGNKISMENQEKLKVINKKLGVQ